MNVAFAAAAVIGTAACFAHPLLGRRHVANLLAEGALPKTTRWLAYLCWHAITVIFLVITGVLAAGAAGLVSNDAVAVVGTLSFGIAVLTVAVAVKGGFPPFRFPSSYVLGAVTLLVAAGL